MPPPTRRRRRIATPELWCLGLALIVAAALLGTSLRPGYALFLDHITVPSPAAPDWQYLLSAVGLRAWPLDGVVWAWSLAQPTWVLQHVILLGSLLGAGGGAGDAPSYPRRSRASTASTFPTSASVLALTARP